MNGYSRILCPVDLSADSRLALEYAGAAARWYGAQLTVLHVVPEMPMANVIPSLTMIGPSVQTPATFKPTRLARATERFVRAAVPARVRYDVRLVEERNAATEIAAEVRALRIDLVVMLRHRRDGLSHVLSPSVTESVLGTVACPVLVLPDQMHEAVAPGDVAFDHIVCGVDFSNQSINAVATALVMAEDADAHLTLLNVPEVPAELRAHAGFEEVDVAAERAADVAERLRRLRQLLPEGARTYCRVETMVGEGSAGREILRVAAEQNADLIVMGVRGHNALDRLVFGSSARQVVQEATRPVLLVH